MTPEELLRQLNELDEHPRIEAKKASELGKSALETVCAFSNEPGLGGGWLLLGVARVDDGDVPVYEVTGVPDSDAVQATLASQCAETFNIPVRPLMDVAIVEGKRVVAVQVPEAPASAKPVYFRKRSLPSGAFRRIGSSDVRCTDEDLAVFYGDRSGQAHDTVILPDAEMQEIDSTAVAEYRRLRAQVSPGAEELSWSDEDLLRSLRCAELDSKGVLRPTRAGMLLFGTGFGLKRHFPMMRVDYIRVPGREWIEDPYAPIETLELRAPLIRVVGKAVNAILDELPKFYSLPPNDIHRRETPLIPARVLREAVVNAVMHRSYRAQGATQIIRYANRLEIRNFGYSLVDDDRLGKPGSLTRNPQIATVFHDINMAESKGSGIRIMRRLLEEAQLTPPTFESSRQDDLFVATFFFRHFLDEGDWQWLRTLDVPGLTDEEARALVFVRETGSIVNSTYREMNRVDVLNASIHLRRLRDLGLLQQEGKGPITRYRATVKLLAGAPRTMEGLHPITHFDASGTKREHQEKPGNLETEPGRSGTEPVKPGTEPVKPGTEPVKPGTEPVKPGTEPVKPKTEPVKPGTEPVKLGTEPVKPGTEPVKPGTGREMLLASLPIEVVLEIEKLKSKAPLEKLQRVALLVCAVGPRTTEELASLLRRNRNYFTNKVITPLLRAHQLKPTQPGQPNHPHQSYRTAIPTPGGPPP